MAKIDKMVADLQKLLKKKEALDKQILDAGKKIAAEAKVAPKAAPAKKAAPKKAAKKPAAKKAAKKPAKPAAPKPVVKPLLNK